MSGSEKDRPQIKGLNPSRRGRPGLLIGQSVVASMLEGKGYNVLDAHRYTGEEILKIGDGDERAGARRILLAALRTLSMTPEEREAAPRPFQEILEDAEPTAFGVIPTPEKPN